MANGFIGGYALREISHRLWQYIPDRDHPLGFHYAPGCVIWIDRKFDTDGATIPRLFWSLPGFDPLDWPRAACLHDFLWELERAGIKVGYFWSNRILRQALRSLGWSLFLCWTIWLAVTLFGWWFWFTKQPGTLRG